MVCLSRIRSGGFSGGLGRALTQRLPGCRVYIASRKQKELERVAKEINSSKGCTGEVRVLVANLMSKNDCYKLAEDLKKAGETKLHILCNNSGLTWGAPLDDFPEEQGWDKILAVNVKSMFYLTVACLPMLEAAGREGGNKDPAHVINVTSGAGVSPTISGLGAKGTVTPSYAASKAAGNHLTRALAGQLIGKNIIVNVGSLDASSSIACFNDVVV